MAKTVMTPVGILNFPTFFTPQASRQNPAQAPRYSGMLVFDEEATKSTAYANLRAAVMEAVSEKFGDLKAQDQAFLRTLRYPFRDASEKEYTAPYGTIFISAWSHGYASDDTERKNPLTPPGVVDLHGNAIADPNEVYSGQLARFTVRPFAYDSNGNKGVSLGLEHVQIVKKDAERIDGRRSADQAFANAGGDADEELKRLGIDPAATAAATPPVDNLPF